MEHSIQPPLELIRPWRRATIVATAVAAVELVVLAGAGVALLGNPLAQHMRASAIAAAAPRVRPAATAPAATGQATLSRGDTSVLVLNGNGRAGAAAGAADRVRAHGYLVGNVGNAARNNFTRTLVMYRPGYAAEGVRLGRDLNVRIVTPLDGMRPGQLMGAHLVLIVGS